MFSLLNNQLLIKCIRQFIRNQHERGRVEKRIDKTVLPASSHRQYRSFCITQYAKCPSQKQYQKECFVRVGPGLRKFWGMDTRSNPIRKPISSSRPHNVHGPQHVWSIFLNFYFAFTLDSFPFKTKLPMYSALIPC